MAPPQKQLSVDNSVDDVLSNFRAAAAKHEDVFTLTALAHLLADLGRSQEAESCFEKALKCPHHAAPKDGSSSCDSETRGLALGWYAALVEGNGSEGAAKAEGLYREALQMNERDPLAMGNYAVFLHRIKRDHRVSYVNGRWSFSSLMQTSTLLRPSYGRLIRPECVSQKRQVCIQPAKASFVDRRESAAPLVVSIMITTSSSAMTFH